VVRQHRDGGYVVSTVDIRHTGGYAITSERIELGMPASGW